MPLPSCFGTNADSIISHLNTQNAAINLEYSLTTMVSTTGIPSSFQPLASAPNGNHVPLSKTATTDSIRSTNSTYEAPPKHIPSLTTIMPEAPKNYKDVLAYEDKWVGWDGPVWCKRYGRFENADDAARDDGFESSGQVHHQGKFYNLVYFTLADIEHPPLIDLGPQHKHREGCTCGIPPKHRSYVEDIKRRVEPMVASLVGLEHQVSNLIHHTGLGTHVPHDDKPELNTGVMDNHHHEGNDRFAMHDDGLSQHVSRQAPHKSEAFVKLEAEIHKLQHQMHELMKKDGAAEGFIRNT